MSDFFILAHTEARKRAAARCMEAPEGYTVKFSMPKRSNDQNALLHSALTDISEQVEWYGQKLSVDVWKRLCMAAWLRERKEQPMLVPALDGNGVDIIFERTSKLTIAQCSELIEWCFCFGAEHHVKFGK